MTVAANPPLHDLPDRFLRQSLQHPNNLRALLEQAVPQLADRFDCSRAHLLDREFPLDDWRRRETDLPFEIPYRTAEGTELWALVFVLIEQQSSSDPWMPLRMLIYATLYWERCWKRWEQTPTPRPEPRLPPILPLVFYTGVRPWNTNRTLADLLAEPAAFHVFAPRWEPLFWNLEDHSAEQLLASGNEWLQALAVIRAQEEDAAAFAAVFQQAVQALQPLLGRDHPRWYDLLRLLLTWVYWRRPRAERRNLINAVLASETEAIRQREIEAMSQQVEEKWEQWARERGMEIGREEGLAEGELRAHRANLRDLIEDRFGSVPEAVQQQIDGCQDVNRLRAAVRQVYRIESLDQLQL
jgi:predicted transposase YdaD